jgi:protein-L-isoaspartate O-methyltransferase
MGGRLIAPVVERGVQYLVLHEKRGTCVAREILCEVLYVSLRGKYGHRAQ